MPDKISWIPHFLHFQPEQDFVPPLWMKYESSLWENDTHSLPSETSLFRLLCGELPLLFPQLEKLLYSCFPLPLLSCHDWNSRLSKATMIYWNQFYLVRALASRSCANAPSNPQSKIKSPKNIFKWGKKKQWGKGWKFAMLPETWKIRNREMSIFSPKVHICPFTGAKSGIDSLEIRTDRRTGHTVPWLGLQRTHPKHL